MSFDRINNAIKLATLSNYCYDESLDRLKEDPLFQGYWIDEIRCYRLNVRALLLTNNAEYILAIRGSDNLMNALEDVNVIKKEDEKTGIHLHNGFVDEAMEVYNKLIDNRICFDGNKDITLTGHSSGGAVAVILGMYFNVDGLKVSDIVTFGQPKVTNWGGCKKFWTLPLVRVVDHSDPVPLLPPWCVWDLWRPYRHFGEEWRMLDGIIVKSTGLKTWSSSADKIYKGLWSGKIKIGDIEDHRIATYISRLKEL